jgi:NAD(P)-dependent dehydrogenase (short-subunit alcohol dehydrogenase family)
MTSTSTRPALLVVGVGPGLGMSVAHRFGSEGYAVGLISHSSARHDEYLRALRNAGVEAAAFVADAADSSALHQAVGAARAHFGRIDVGYYGPAAAAPLADITAFQRLSFPGHPLRRRTKKRTHRLHGLIRRRLLQGLCGPRHG